MADLVDHLTQVHWFWATIVDDCLSEPPAESRRPARAPRDQLVDRFVTGAHRLVAVLRAADPATELWTWSPRHDAGFVIRHQVQEAAVHHWDAVHAAGGNLEIEAAVAVDAIDEFLTYAISNDPDDDGPPPITLDGKFAIVCSDVDASWTVADGDEPGTIRHDPGTASEAPQIRGTASDLLLWLFERVTIDETAVPAEVIRRFQTM